MGIAKDDVSCKPMLYSSHKSEELIAPYVVGAHCSVETDERITGAYYDMEKGKPGLPPAGENKKVGCSYIYFLLQRKYIIKGIVSRDEYFLKALKVLSAHELVAFTIFRFLIHEKIKLKVLLAPLKFLNNF
jgi:hypothetical protein